MNDSQPKDATLQETGALPVPTIADETESLPSNAAFSSTAMEILFTGLFGLLFTSLLLVAILEYLTSLESTFSSESILLIALTVLSILCVLTVLKTIYSRTVMLRGRTDLVPAEWGQLISLLITENQSYNRAYLLGSRKLDERLNEQGQSSQRLLESFLDLQGALDARDKEIERLRSGGDVKVFQRFLNRFIRVDKALVEMRIEMAGSENEKNYRYLSKVMQDALEECGVEKYEPIIGSDYRDAGDQVSDEVTVVSTTEMANDFLIADIMSPGYVILGEGKMTVIQPAHVKIYRLNADKGEERVNG